ncbi:phage GP46 family protein [Bosea sp. LjRoot9]|uniref:phage GP46 family protein n=1 Tax=Bosea sp. LjRoot9 TaxID=3342341 RepID=UPI003ED0CB2E
MSYDISITKAATATPALFWSTFWDTAENLGDWRLAPANDAVNPGGLDASRQLATAVIISLFTDRRAPEGWRPDVVDRRGWWGDAVAPEGEEPEEIGSHLWLLRNEVATEQVAERARLYAVEALAWMLRDQVAATVTVTAGLIEDPRRGVWLDVQIAGRDGVIVYSQRFARLWAEIK